MDEKLYTVELKRVLTLITKDLLDEYPAKKITTEHFLVSLLNNKQCFAYKILNRLLPQSNMDGIYDFYAKLLHTNSQQKVLLPPNNATNQVGYNLELSNHLTNADNERDKLNDPKINTEHVFLSIISTTFLIKEQFKLLNVTYESFLNEINEVRNDETKKNDDNKSLAESISGFKSKATKKGGIEAYCVNLNKLANQGKIDNLIGRELEINRVIKITGRRSRNNVIIVGLPGVGKSAIVYGIANMIEKQEAKFLNGKTIFSLNTTALIAGTTYRGDLESRMNLIISEFKSNKDYILFIDDIHTVLGNNSGSSAEISGILSNSLSDGEMQVIATTSFKEFKSSIESNTTLNRRFQKIIIEPTSIEETERILIGSKSYYEDYHNVLYSEDAITACVYLANKYITDRQLPDSAIDIMDECGSEKKVYVNTQPDELFEIRKELTKNEELRDKSYRVNDFKLGDVYKKTAKEIEAKIIDIEKLSKSSKKNKVNVKEIRESDVYSTVSEITGIPLSKLSTSEKQRYLNIENTLNQHVIGQEEAVKDVSKAVKRSRMGIRKKDKPSSMLFVGESGVGKTLLAKTLAEDIYGSEKSLIRFDMSEYSDKTSVNKLIGAGSGYVGYEQGGILTETIKNNPYCVLLLDEIEKADKEILNIFLQVFDNGFLSDNSGIKVSFRNVIVIMTSNIGAKDASLLGRGAGFQTNIEDNKKSIIQKSIKSHFPVEFINRLDNIIHFNSLGEDDLKKIIILELNSLNLRLIEIGYSIDFSIDVVDFILKGVKIDNNPGARKINRTIQNEIEDRISDLCLENEYDANHLFKIDVEEEKIKIS